MVVDDETGPEECEQCMQYKLRLAESGRVNRKLEQQLRAMEGNKEDAIMREVDRRMRVLQVETEKGWDS